MKTLDLSPDMFRLTAEEQQQIPIVIQDVTQLSQILNGTSTTIITG